MIEKQIAEGPLEEIVIQEVSYQSETNSVIIKHHDQEINLSISNWERLRDMVDMSIYTHGLQNGIDRSNLSELIVEFKRAEHYYWSDLVENRFKEAKEKSNTIKRIIAKINYKLKNY